MVVVLAIEGVRGGQGFQARQRLQREVVVAGFIEPHRCVIDAGERGVGVIIRRGRGLAGHRITHVDSRPSITLLQGPIDHAAAPCST